MTRHDWIFDVLADLRRFSELNGLPLLSDQIVIAEEVARREIDAAPQDAPYSPPQPG
ncbi:hypothetical protein [Haematobacter massiliensis]|uniref:hypothetical protein n=1 Tax=Haematobacter massiliensis TaxID=195105 RepID=UPI0013F1707A|nr:hypothetical protein [Haematobacter massiliensis]